MKVIFGTLPYVENQGKSIRVVKRDPTVVGLNRFGSSPIPITQRQNLWNIFYILGAPRGANLLPPNPNRLSRDSIALYNYIFGKDVLGILSTRRYTDPVLVEELKKYLGYPDSAIPALEMALTLANFIDTTDAASQIIHRWNAVASKLEDRHEESFDPQEPINNKRGRDHDELDRHVRPRMTSPVASLVRQNKRGRDDDLAESRSNIRQRLDDDMDFEMASIDARNKRGREDDDGFDRQVRPRMTLPNVASNHRNKRGREEEDLAESRSNIRQRLDDDMDYIMHELARMDARNKRGRDDDDESERQVRPRMESFDNELPENIQAIVARAPNNKRGRYSEEDELSRQVHTRPRLTPPTVAPIRQNKRGRGEDEIDDNARLIARRRIDDDMDFITTKMSGIAVDGSALVHASHNGDIETVLRLLQNPRADDVDFSTAVLEASEHGQVALVDRLLRDTRAAEADFRYAIEGASKYGHLSLVDHLLKDPRVDPSANDNAAINLAERNGKDAVVARLLQDSRVADTV